MSTTEIEWTKRPGTIGVTWNVTTGCNKVDRGCKHCYAETMHRRLQAMGQPKYKDDFLGGAKTHSAALYEPMNWKKSRTVFVNSMSDLFHDMVDFNFLIDVLQVIKVTADHTYLVLTKRPERAFAFQQHMEACSAGEWDWPLNLWLGTSINDQASADLRIPRLLDCSTARHFISFEPATGPADISRFLKWEPYASGLSLLDWVIMGGESGAKAQPMHPQWARNVRDQCAAAKTAFFFKQHGIWVPYEVLYPEGPPAGVTHTCKYIYDEQGRPQKMVRAKKKSYNLLDGQLHQNFPA